MAVQETTLEEPVFEDELETDELGLEVASEQSTLADERQLPGEPEIQEELEEMAQEAEPADLESETIQISDMTMVQDEPQPAVIRPERKSRYVFVADEELESLQVAPAKSKKRKVHRQIVRDDESGKLIVRRRHKRDDELDLDEYLDR